MKNYTRSEIRRLKPEIRRLIEEAGKRRDTHGFIKWLQEHAGSLSLERQAEIVAEFKRIVADESAKARPRR